MSFTVIFPSPRLAILLPLLAVATLAAADISAPPAATPPVSANFTTASLQLRVTPKVPTPFVPNAANATASTSAGLLDQWTIASSGETSYYWQLAWLGDSFVGVGSDGAVVTSPDGLHWTKHPTNSKEQLDGVATNGKIQVVVGTNGTILTSPDFEKWTKLPALVSERLFAVVWQGSQFLAFGADGAIASSPDGLTWTTGPRTTTVTFHHGLWTRGQFVMSAFDGLLTSPDGLVWRLTQRTNQRMMAVAANVSQFVAVGEQPYGILTSPTGASWAPANLSVHENISGVIWTGAQFIAVGSNDTLLSSPDGAVWTARRTGTGLDLNDLAQHGDVVVVGTRTGEILINKHVEKTAAPEISLAPGAPGSVPQILLTCATAGAKIYYTDDGRNPTTSAKLYTGPFTVAHACTIATRAFKDQAIPSDLAAALFTPGPTAP